MADSATFEISSADLLTFLEDCERHNGTFQSVHRLSFTLFSMLAVGLGLALTRPPLGAMAIALVAGLVLPLLLHPFVWPFDYRFHLRRALKRGHMRTALGHHTLTLEATGVRERREAAETFHAWSGVEAVRVARDHIYILIGPDTGYIVPKRSFRDSNAAEAFSARSLELWRTVRPPASR